MSLHPIARLRARIHALARALVAEHASPTKLFTACLAGGIVGATPFFGFHFFLCVAVAWVMRLNKVTVYAAAHISSPPFIPLLGFTSVEMGELLRHGHFLHISLADFRGVPLHTLAARFFIDWMIGGVVVGAALGAVIGVLVYSVARRRATVAADPVRRAIALASARFRRRGVRRPLRMYAWFKYRLDPCYRLIAPRLPEGGLTVDLGTGLGMLPIVAALLPGGRRVLGVEWDEHKLAAGKLAAEDLPHLELTSGDLRSCALPPCDAVTLVDVLHYFAPDVQRAILERCAQALNPGGVLLIRDGDARHQTGRFTRAVEELAVRIGWNRGAGKTRFRPAEELVAELEALGLYVTVDEAAGKLHPGNVLLSARKTKQELASAPANAETAAGAETK